MSEPVKWRLWLALLLVIAVVLAFFTGPLLWAFAVVVAVTWGWAEWKRAR
jgi:hypothetical protein